MARFYLRDKYKFKFSLGIIFHCPNSLAELAKVNVQWKFQLIHYLDIDFADKLQKLLVSTTELIKHEETSQFLRVSSYGR